MQLTRSKRLPFLQLRLSYTQAVFNAKETEYARQQVETEQSRLVCFGSRVLALAEFERQRDLGEIDILRHAKSKLKTWNLTTIVENRGIIIFYTFHNSVFAHLCLSSILNSFQRYLDVWHFDNFKTDQTSIEMCTVLIIIANLWNLVTITVAFYIFHNILTSMICRFVLRSQFYLN